MKCSIPQKRGVFGVAVIICAVLCSVSATATNVLYTNLGPTGQFDLTTGYFIDGYQVIADPFVLGSGAVISDALLALSNLRGSNHPMDVYIESNSGAFPGSILAQLTQVGTIAPYSSGGGLVTFTCSGPGCTLAAGSYWLVASEPDIYSIQSWQFAYQPQAVDDAFNFLGSPTGPWRSDFGTAGGFRLDGTTTPEPGTLILFGTAVLGLVGAARRNLR